MVQRIWQRMLLGPGDVRPSSEDFEVVGVLNPGAIATPTGVAFLLRVAERPRERNPGAIGLPRWHDGSLEVDWVAEADVLFVDARVVRRRDSGDVRLTFASHLLLATSRDGRVIDTVSDLRFLPECELEEFGVEDARITRLVDRYYFTYVAVSRHGAATALGSTKDFRTRAETSVAFRSAKEGDFRGAKGDNATIIDSPVLATFERHGIVFPPENKDVVLFPEPIAGRYAALHRPNPATLFHPPEMWLAWSSNLRDWGEHEPLSFAPADWESGRVGAGVPPIRTEKGWLEIYHGNRRPERPGEVGQYAAGALLLDLHNPAKVIGRSLAPILFPLAAYELQGFVPGVVFPTAAVDCGETLLLYCGAADTCVVAVEISWQDLWEAME